MFKVFLFHNEEIWLLTLVVNFQLNKRLTSNPIMVKRGVMYQFSKVIKKSIFVFAFYIPIYPLAGPEIASDSRNKENSSPVVVNTPQFEKHYANPSLALDLHHIPSHEHSPYVPIEWS